MKKRHTYLFMILFILLTYILGITTYAFSAVDYSFMRTNSDNISKEPVKPGNRILIVVPHPDDETIGMGGGIYNWLKQGKKIKVVIMTNGDGFRKAVIENLKVQNPVSSDYIKLGKMRQNESIEALKELGLSPKDVIFLGYGDGTLSYLWWANWESSKPRNAANGYAYSPYSNSYVKHTGYAGENVLANLTQIIKDYDPTDIFYPDPDDMHPDHWATSNFVRLAVEKSNCKATLYSFLVHHYQWPVPLLYVPETGLYPPLSLETSGTKWHINPLDNATVRIKHKAMLKYKSQYKVMAGFLDSFIRKNELFGTYDDRYYLVGKDIKPNFAQRGPLPYAVIQSGANDNPLLRIEGSDDISAVGLASDGNNYYFALQMRGNANKDTSYFLNALILYKDGKMGRLRINIKDFKAEEIMDSKDSIDVGNISAGHYKNRIWFTVPANKIGSPTKIFLNAETYFIEKRIDKTAWRMVMPQYGP